jgi:hypothetical protein
MAFDKETLLFKKGPQPRMGDSYGLWENRPDPIWTTLPGGDIMSFDLNALTLADFRAMRYHPQINASISVLTFMIHQIDWEIECEDEKIADMVEENLRTIWTRLVRGMSQSFWAGFSPNVLEYENDPQGKYVIINKVKDLIPEECEVHWKEKKASDPRVKHKMYEYDGIDQWGFGTIPVQNSFWYPLLMENGDYQGRKLLKAAFMPWYFSMLMHLYTNRYFERFGEPLPIGRAPFDEEIVEADGTRQSGKEIMEDIILQIRNRSGVILPSDRDPATGTGSQAYLWDIDYLESQMRGVDFERYLSRLDEEISLALFTPLLLLRNADTGSHNLGVQHTQTWLWMLNALTGDMKEYIDRYICERLKEINFSPKAPKVEWKPRSLGKDSVETQRAVLVELIRGNKAMVDVEELGLAMGMEIEEVEQVLADPAMPVDPNAPQDEVNGNDGRQRTERTDRTTPGAARTVGNDAASSRPETTT